MDLEKAHQMRERAAGNLGGAAVFTVFVFGISTIGVFWGNPPKFIFFVLAVASFGSLVLSLLGGLRLCALVDDLRGEVIGWRYTATQARLKRDEK